MIRPPFADEREYILSSWVEAYRYAPGQRKRRWRDYEPAQRATFAEVLDHEDTVVLVKVDVGEDVDVVLGWIVFARGKIVADTVHWIQTRHSLAGAKLRKHGTMRELVESARLKPHIAYTFRGALPRDKDEPRVTSDEWIVPWLAKRGIGAVYQAWKDWR